MKSEDRASLYKNTSNFARYYVDIEKKIIKKNLKFSFFSLKKFSHGLKQEEKKLKISLVFRDNTRLKKLFKTLKFFSIDCRNKKFGFSKMEFLLKGFNNKIFFFKKIKSEFIKEKILKKIIEEKMRKIQFLEKKKAMKDLLKNRIFYDQKYKLANFNKKRLEKKIKKKVMKFWRVIVYRRKNVSKVGKKLEYQIDEKIIKKFFKIWKTSVLFNENSLFKREIVLKNALTKLHILRTIDHLNDFKELNINRRSELASSLGVVDEWIQKKKLSNAFFEIKNHVDFLDNRDYCVESLMRIVEGKLKKINYGKFFDILKRKNLAVKLQENFLKVRFVNVKSNVFMIWKKMAYLNQNLRVRFEIKRDERKKKIVFEGMKNLVLGNENSIFSKQKIVEEKLSVMRVKRVFSVLKLNRETSRYRRKREVKVLKRVFRMIEKGIWGKVWVCFNKMMMFQNIEKGAQKVKFIFNFF